MGCSGLCGDSLDMEAETSLEDAAGVPSEVQMYLDG